MGDNISCEILANVIHMLDSCTAKENGELIERVWGWCKEYDFHPDELEMNDVLEKYDLARPLEVDEWGYQEWHYKGLDY